MLHCNMLMVGMFRARFAPQQSGAMISHQDMAGG